MPPIGVLPSLALVAGAAAGSALDLPPCCVVGIGIGIGMAACAAAIWWRRGRVAAYPSVLAACWCAGALLAADARERAIHTPLRTVLNGQSPGFEIESVAVPREQDPVATRGVMLEDASRSELFTSLRVSVTDVRLSGRWQPAEGNVILSVGGAGLPAAFNEWRAGRAIEAPVTYRRPSRYLNQGVPDVERALALDDITLLGSIKSGLLVEVVSRGTTIEEWAGRVRVLVRRALERWVGSHDPLSAAIVTAVLIGDRTGLPDEVRTRLQTAGTYHVIAISGGNIAILAGVSLGLLALAGAAARPAAFGTLLVLLAYAEIVASSPSVWRAVVMATVYLTARLLDHRSPPWQGMAVAAALVACVQPLTVRDAGFLLTFGATAALLEVARLSRQLRHAGVPARRGATVAAFRWLGSAVAASVAVEVALLPVSASTFSRVTGAGIVLNLLAVPLMGVTQIAGMVTVAAGTMVGTWPALRAPVESIAWLGGWLAHFAAAGIVTSARLIEVAPWLIARVASPPMALVVVYYGALAALVAGRGRVRLAGAAGLAATALLIVSGVEPMPGAAETPSLRLTVFDVGQGDSILLELPGRAGRGMRLLIDAGGAPFGGGGFDIGARVLAPALWARGVRSLEALLLTHGDPDHIGGAAAVVDDFRPATLWEGIAVPGHPGLRAVRARAAARGVTIEALRAGRVILAGDGSQGARLRVLHPPAPDWERQTVRNDDSMVLEAVFGDVAVLLTGDAGADVERAILPRLTSAAIRILKVGHHGSRTSTSPELLAAWRPTMALVSAGRGNRFGHPAPDVIARLKDAGAKVYRTDLDGQITVTTDGHDVRVQTFVGERP